MKTMDRARYGMALVTLLLGLSGCINNLEATVAPGSDLGALRSYAVVKHSKDSNDVAGLIQARLTSMGLQATVVAEGAPIPASTDVVVVYTDKWAWDMTMYMLELTVNLKKAQSDFPIASGKALHGSLTRRSPKEMVDEVIGEIFKSPKVGA